MRALFFFVLGFLFVVPSYATKIAHKSLSDMVKEADHIVVVKIEKVMMVDGNGKEVKNLKARTGPGLDNEIQLQVKTVKDGIMKSNHKKFPAKFSVALWKKWHKSLGGCKDLQGKTLVFLLKGKNLQRVYHGGFMRSLEEKKKILQLMLQHKKEQQNAKK